MKTVYRGVFPVAPTVFDGNGDLDLEGQKRCTDFMIDAGSQGICILANWSEQFVLTDDERERVMDCVLAHVAGCDACLAAVGAVLSPVLTDIIRQGLRDGAFDTPDPEGVAEMMLQFGTAMHGIVARAVAADNADQVNEVNEAIHALEQRTKLYEIALDRILQRPLTITVILPWLALFQQSKSRTYREALRIEARFDLVPIERHRNRCSRSRPGR